MRISKTLILFCLLSPVTTYAGSGIKSAIEANAYNATNQAFSYGNSAIESWARDKRRPCQSLHPKG